MQSETTRLAKGAGHSEHFLVFFALEVKSAEKMADNVSQRSFSKQLHKGTTPAQMREKASDAMRSISQTTKAEEEEFPARVKISDPLDYEKELLNVRDEVKRFQNAKLLALVLYPVDDISVS